MAKRILFAAAVVQAALTARPLLGILEYHRSRATFQAQREAILALLMEVSR